MDHYGSSPPLMTNGYDLTNLDQFINLIQGEPGAVPDYDILRGCLFAGDPIPADMFDGHVPMAAPEAGSLTNMEPDVMMMRGGDVGEFDYYNDDGYSGTADSNPTAGEKKHDRSRTLVSERRRRHCMKEKLYALRSLVPNITKLDKASIVGDAAAYVQQLQMQAKKLESEIAGLETSLMSTCAKPNPNLHVPCTKMILQMDVFQVEERGFFVRLVCNKGQGIAASLYKALSGFIVQSSNLATVSETFVFTFTLKMREPEEELNLPDLKLWVTGAFMNEGFEIKN